MPIDPDGIYHMQPQQSRANYRGRKKGQAKTAPAGRRGAVHVTNVVHLHVEAAKKIKHKGA